VLNGACVSVCVCECMCGGMRICMHVCFGEHISPVTYMTSELRSYGEGVCSFGGGGRLRGGSMSNSVCVCMCVGVGMGMGVDGWVEMRVCMHACFGEHIFPVTYMTSKLRSYRGRCVCGFLGGVIVGGSMLNGVCVYVGVSVGVGGYACLYACVFR
jgi:uncharacterized membrane protein YoaK (UPF0700 family)